MDPLLVTIILAGYPAAMLHGMVVGWLASQHDEPHWTDIPLVIIGLAGGVSVVVILATLVQGFVRAVS